jgi:hypothetical protein
MSENTINKQEYAEAADLLAPATGTKEVELKTIKGKKVVIQKIKVGDLSAIMKVAKDNEMDQYVWLVFKGLVRPAMSPDEIKKLGHTTLIELAYLIQDYSGLDKDSINNLENLLKTGSSEPASK